MRIHAGTPPTRTTLKSVKAASVVDCIRGRCSNYLSRTDARNFDKALAAMWPIQGSARAGSPPANASKGAS